MSVVYIALPAVLLLALAGVIAFVWAVRSGQLDDLETPGMRILGDDEEPPSDDRSCGLEPEPVTLAVIDRRPKNQERKTRDPHPPSSYTDHTDEN